MAKTKKITLGKGQSDPQIKRWLFAGTKGGYNYYNHEIRPYKESVDDERKAKPVGYRFSKDGAKKLGVDPFRKPTKEEIEKLKNKKTRSGGKVIYRETRINKTDVNPKRRK